MTKKKLNRNTRLQDSSLTKHLKKLIALVKQLDEAGVRQITCDGEAHVEMTLAFGDALVEIRSWDDDPEEAPVEVEDRTVSAGVN